MQDFRRLRVWQEAQELTVAVYAMTEPLRGTRAAGARSQLRRAAASIAANIAEGAAQDAATQFARYLQIAIGSTSELENHLDLGQRVHLLPKAEVTRLLCTTQSLRRQLATLRKRILESVARKAPSPPTKPKIQNPNSEPRT